jgi:integrase
MMTIKLDDNGDYRDEMGRLFVRCKADKSSPFFIDVSSFRVETEWRSMRCRIDLYVYKLPLVMIEAAKHFIIKKLGVVSPEILDPFGRSLKILEDAWQTEWTDFSSISLGELFKIVANGNPHYTSQLRRFYCHCAHENLAGADEVYSIELRSLSVNKNRPYDAVLKWHEIRGAMTSAEQELVRRAMMDGSPDESIAETTSRLFAWICFETLKRPWQIVSMHSDALWVPIDPEDNKQYFLRIPKAKFQTGEKSELWPITIRLAHAIERYSELPSVRLEQSKSRKLLISLKEGKIVGLGRMMTKWATRQGIVSPRTQELLVLTPYRIRHSGATQMAAQGASSDEIQYVLEHDSAGAAQAYIDCLASEFCPLIERANRKLGGVFTDLNNLFFNGSIGNSSSGSPVLIPAVNMPAVVGECSKDGLCGQHPFFNCYNGCRYFIAWRDADHERSLRYLESEMLRWGMAEGGKDRSKFLKDLERTYHAVKDVVQRIEGGE